MPSPKPEQSPEVKAQWADALDEAIISGGSPDIPPPPPPQPAKRRRWNPADDISKKLEADLKPNQSFGTWQ